MHYQWNAGNDVLPGTDLDDEINGLAGDDMITGWPVSTL